jgi:Kef-type K+ transport system membrane component KefB
MELENIVSQLIVIYAGVAVLATLFLFLKQPIIISYILLGVLMGPYGFGVLQDVEQVRDVSTIGVIFLLFLIGLNLPPKKLTSLFQKTAGITLITSFSFTFLAMWVAYAFGFSLTESLIIGAALMFSSTVIGLKLTPTSTLHQKHMGEMIISILLFQDILAVLILTFLGNSSNTNPYFILPLVLIKAVGMVGLAFLIVKYVLLPLFQKFDVFLEYIFLVALGWCLAFAGLTHEIGLSYEIGAFIAGCALAMSPISLYIAESLKSLREFFLILFFFAIGAQINFPLLQEVLLPGLVLGVLVLYMKPVVFKQTLQKFGEQRAHSKELGFRLGQASEFSLLVAFAALSYGKISEKAFSLVQIVTIISLVVSTYIVTNRYVTPIGADKAHRKQ